MRSRRTGRTLAILLAVVIPTAHASGVSEASGGGSRNNAVSRNTSAHIDIKTFGKRLAALVAGLNERSDITNERFRHSLKVGLRPNAEGDVFVSPEVADGWTLSVQRFGPAPPLKAGFQVGLYMESIIGSVDKPCMVNFDTFSDALKAGGFDKREEPRSGGDPLVWTFTKNDIVLRVYEDDLVEPENCVRVVSTMD